MGSSLWLLASKCPSSVLRPRIAFHLLTAYSSYLTMVLIASPLLNVQELEMKLLDLKKESELNARLREQVSLLV